MINMLRTVMKTLSNYTLLRWKAFIPCSEMWFHSSGVRLLNNNTWIGYTWLLLMVVQPGRLLQRREFCPTDLHFQETDGGCRWPIAATIFHLHRFQKGLRLNRPQSDVQDTEALWDPRGDGTSHESTLRQLEKCSVRWWTSHERVQCHHGSATRRCLGTFPIHHHDWL